MNRIIFIGRLTHDPETRHTQSGDMYAKFCLAVDRHYKNSNGKHDTDFINCVSLRKTAELILEYCIKGSLIAVEGSLQSRRFQTKEGANRTTFEVQIDNVQFLGSHQRSEASAHEDSGPPPDTGENGSELPF